ncbi:G-protein coupled receptor [Dermatophagoides pteronyssinus]|uniref:G-protein coupled receptor n=1 Tax=Dermatophagoides pteronyssinus TaxID=6956 RepID=A0ABQ8JD71_DERPT|nr:G-protein coupled receptor [Dermatophagoides pteronyssinus]
MTFFATISAEKTIFISFNYHPVLIGCRCDDHHHSKFTTAIIIFHMRKSTINIYLTVLTLYDNGVLIFSVLMLNIPSIADYQLQQLHEQQMLATVVANISFINDTNCLESVPSIILTYNCNITNRTNNDDNSLYCNLLLRIKSYSNIENSIPIDRILQNCITKWSIQMDSKCFQILNKTLNILDHFNERKIIIPDKLLLFENHFTKLLLAAIKTNYNMTINDVVDDDYYQQRFCSNSSDWISIDDNDSDDSSNIECPAIDLPYSPLVYYVKIVYPLALFAQTGSIWTTCLITIERYLAVCHPLMTMTLSTRARAIWALTLLSIVAFLFNLPRFAEVDTTCYQVRPTEFRHNKIYYQVYYIFLNLTFNYIIPLSLLAALNVKIYLSVQQASQNRSELTRARQSELHLASMFIAIVAIFIACNAPAFLCNCLEPYFKVGTPVLELMTIFANVLVCINSSINFVIYCIFGRKFRSKFLRLLRIDQWCRRGVSIGSNLMESFLIISACYFYLLILSTISFHIDRFWPNLIVNIL